MPSPQQPQHLDVQTTGTRFTFFHVLWLFGPLICAPGAFILLAQAQMWFRIACTAGSAAVGLVLAATSVTWLVATVAPHVPVHSHWSREIDCYMRSIFGSRWDGLDRGRERG